MLKKQKIILFLAIGISASFFAVKVYGCSWEAITTCDTRVSECLPGQAWNPNYWYWSSDCGILWCVNHPMGWPIGTCAWITGWTCNSSNVAVPTWGYDHNFGGGCPGDATPPSCVTNGTCGSANGGTFSSAPTANLCSAGTNSVVSNSRFSWDWKCNGSNNGSTNDDVSCSACNPDLGKINGACNDSVGKAVAPYPTTCSAPVNMPVNTNLCSVGTASAVTGAGPWTWTCAGSCGGEAANCRADQASVSCGSADNSKSCSKPSNNLCPSEANNPNPSVSGPAEGPWTWTCSCGSSNTSCQATKQQEEPFTIENENCSVSCGGGSRKIGGVKKCVGNDLIITNITEACNSQPCPPGYREVAPW